MGYEWLTTLETALRAEGFRVERGYPAKNAIYLTGPVAAVNLTGVDTQKQSTTVTVTVLVPRRCGLDQCQQMAQKAAVILAGQGGQWRFTGWKFDEKISCFYAEVEGTVYFSAQEGTWVPEQGYAVLIGDEIQNYVTDFRAQQSMNRRLIRPHGQYAPVGITPGRDGWIIKLTQMLPSGVAEPAVGAEPFALTVKRGGQSLVYQDCCWSDYSSRQCELGTQVIRSGFALRREASEDGQDEV